jgi:DnaJ-class molecular chaperone
MNKFLKKKLSELSCEDNRRSYIPFTDKNKTIFTDAKFIIIINDNLQFSENKELSDLTKKLIEEVIELNIFSSSSFNKLECGNPYNISDCSACKGTGLTLECDECEGEGNVLLSFDGKYDDYEKFEKCIHCNGKGLLYGKGKTCQSCNGKKQIKTPLKQKYNNYSVDYNYIKLINELTCFTAEFYHEKTNGYIVFKFNNGFGILMPMTD